MTDDELIEHVASSTDTTLIPAPYLGVGVKPMIDRLVELGVMPEPEPTDLMTDVIKDARAACRRWLSGGAQATPDGAAR